MLRAEFFLSWIKLGNGIVDWIKLSLTLQFVWVKINLRKLDFNQSYYVSPKSCKTQLRLISFFFFGLDRVCFRELEFDKFLGQLKSLAHRKQKMGKTMASWIASAPPPHLLFLLRSCSALQSWWHWASLWLLCLLFRYHGSSTSLTLLILNN